jgi:3-oxoacyl-[acyl-carrier-protein] synthase-3
MIGIRAISPFLPGQKNPVTCLPEVTDLTASGSSLFFSTGIKSVLDAVGYSGYDLAHEASKKIMDEEGISAVDIDLIIFVKSRLPDSFSTSEATRLQHDLGAKKALAYTISDLGCTDMSMALKQSMDFLAANGDAENVLICYGCKPVTSKRYRHPVTINGDGGIAVLVGRTDNNRLLDIEMKINGSYWNLFKTEYLNKSFDDYCEIVMDERKYGFELAMESRNVFHELNQKILQRNNLDKTKIRHYLLQNISSRAFQFYESAYDIKISPVCPVNLAQYGHLGPADVMLNYHTGVANSFFKKGDYVLIMNNSPVAAWSSLLVQV